MTQTQYMQKSSVLSVSQCQNFKNKEFVLNQYRNLEAAYKQCCKSTDTGYQLVPGIIKDSEGTVLLAMYDICVAQQCRINGILVLTSSGWMQLYEEEYEVKRIADIKPPYSLHHAKIPYNISKHCNGNIQKRH